MLLFYRDTECRTRQVNIKLKKLKLAKSKALLHLRSETTISQTLHDHILNHSFITHYSLQIFNGTRFSKSREMKIKSKTFRLRPAKNKHFLHPTGFFIHHDTSPSAQNCLSAARAFDLLSVLTNRLRKSHVPADMQVRRGSRCTARCKPMPRRFSPT